MVAIWHHIKVSLKVLAQKGFIGIGISLGEMHQIEVHWGKEYLLIGEYWQNGLLGIMAEWAERDKQPI
jgi:hypothetical protein